MDTKNIMDALKGDGGDGQVAAKGGEADYRALYEQTQKQLQSERVEAGRLRKTQDELAALRRKYDEAMASRRTEDAIAALPEDLKADVPDDYQRGSAVIAQATVDQALVESRERLRDMEERLAAREREDQERRMAGFLGEVDTRYPGFLKSITSGDKADAWRNYRGGHAATIQSALDSGDLDSLGYHVERFYDSIGVQVPSGGPGSAAPDPRPVGGSSMRTATAPDGARAYSTEDWIKAQDEAQARFQSHQMSFQDYAAVCDELTRAFKEGRVK